MYFARLGIWLKIDGITGLDHRRSDLTGNGEAVEFWEETPYPSVLTYPMWFSCCFSVEKRWESVGNLQNVALLVWPLMHLHCMHVWIDGLVTSDFPFLTTLPSFSCGITERNAESIHRWSGGRFDMNFHQMPFFIRFFTSAMTFLISIFSVTFFIFSWTFFSFDRRLFDFISVSFLF